MGSDDRPERRHGFGGVAARKAVFPARNCWSWLPRSADTKVSARGRGCRGKDGPFRTGAGRMDDSATVAADSVSPGPARLEPAVQALRVVGMVLVVVAHASLCHISQVRYCPW